MAATVGGGTYESQMKERLFAPLGMTRTAKAGPGNLVGLLEPVAYDTFLLKWPEGGISLPEQVTFTLTADGTPSSLDTESFGRLMRNSDRW